jgi:hypothetical protein
MLKKPDNEEALHQWANTIIEDARDLRRGHETAWWEQLCIYGGDLWVNYNPHSLNVWKSLRLPITESGWVSISANPIVRTEYAKVLKNKPILDWSARSGDKSDLDAAETADKIWNSYVEKKFAMPKVRRDAVIWTLTCGLGAVFVDYDETADGQVDVVVGPDGEPIFDPAMLKSVQRYYKDKKKAAKTTSIPQGEFRVRALGPMQWGWDFATNDYTQAQWGFVSETYDVNEVYRRWNVEVNPTNYAKPNILERRVLEKVDLTGTIVGSSQTPDSQELVVVHRLFIRPGHRYFRDGAEIIYTEDEFIDATPYPYGHGELPISAMGHIPMPGSRYPLSVVSQIRDPVLQISKTESQIVENRDLMGNPPWIEYDYHNIPEGKLTNEPGLRIKIPFRPNGSDPHPVEMPELPQYVQQLPEQLLTFINTIAGQGETSQGRVPPGARSGVAIAYLQEEDDTKLGPTIQEFEEMIERMAWQLMRTMAERYDLPRMAIIPKKHAEPEIINFTGTMLAGVGGVNVQAGSALPRSKAAKQQFMLDLYQMGIETDPRKIKEMLELGEGQPEEWERDMEQAERENQRMAQGQQQKVLDWYNHMAHLVVHRRFMKTPDFEAYPEQIQQIYIDHDALHQRFLTGVAVAQQAGVPTPNQSVPQPQMGNGQNNQAPAQGGPVASSNGSSPPPSPVDYQPQ